MTTSQLWELCRKEQGLDLTETAVAELVQECEMSNAKAKNTLTLDGKSS